MKARPRKREKEQESVCMCACGSVCVRVRDENLLPELNPGFERDTDTEKKKSAATNNRKNAQELEKVAAF